MLLLYLIKTFDGLKENWESWHHCFMQWLTISPFVTGNTNYRGEILRQIMHVYRVWDIQASGPHQNWRITSLNRNRSLMSSLVWRGSFDWEVRTDSTVTDNRRINLLLSICHSLEVGRLLLLCEWLEDYFQENLRDTFVMGLHSECLLQQLLTQGYTKTLDETFELAATFETAKHESLKRAEDCQTSNSNADSTISVVERQSNKNYKSTDTHSKQPVVCHHSKHMSQKSCTCDSIGGNHQGSVCHFRHAKCCPCSKVILINFLSIRYS